jgi:hypothetical protein
MMCSLRNSPKGSELEEHLKAASTKPCSPQCRKGQIDGQVVKRRTDIARRWFAADA